MVLMQSFKDEFEMSEGIQSMTMLYLDLFDGMWPQYKLESFKFGKNDRTRDLKHCVKIVCITWVQQVNYAAMQFDCKNYCVLMKIGGLLHKPTRNWMERTRHLSFYSDNAKISEKWEAFSYGSVSRNIFSDV